MTSLIPRRDPVKNYFPMPNEIFSMDLCAGEIAVYAYLMYRENRKSHQCWPGYKTIGSALHMSSNTVRKYVRQLEEKGFILTALSLPRLSVNTMVLHLGFLAAAALWLPLRVYAASAALPYCLLKMPHLPNRKILRAAFRLSSGQTAATVFLRLCTLPLLPLPFTAVSALPVLLAAEQIRFANAWRHQQPGQRNAFSELELHAAEPDPAA